MTLKLTKTSALQVFFKDLFLKHTTCTVSLLEFYIAKETDARMVYASLSLHCFICHGMCVST